MHNSIEVLNIQDFSLNFFETLKKKGRSYNTLKNYKTDLTCFINFLENEGDKVNFMDIDAEIIRYYGQFLEVKYTSSNSRRRRVQSLRIFFDYLVENQIFSSNPVRMIPSSPKFVDKPRPASLVDIKTLFSYLINEIHMAPSGDISEILHYRNLVIMLLVYTGGVRVSDIKDMKIDQIFLEDPPRVLIKHPKRDPYSIPLPLVFKKVFLKYRRLLNKQKKISKKDFKNLLFNANQFAIIKGGLSPRGQEVLFEEIRRKLMIEVTPKSLRQACIFAWLQLGYNDQTIKDWLGMAPSYSLSRYKNHLSHYSYDHKFLEKIIKRI